MQGLDCTRFVLYKVWIVQGFERARFGPYNAWIVQGLDRAKFGILNIIKTLFIFAFYIP